MQLRADGIKLFSGLERPVLVLAFVARMLVGLGLAIALLLQVYMLLLTDYRCEADATSLGNMIRCADPINLIASAVVLLAGIGLASALFTTRRPALIETIMMVLCAVVLRFLADLELSSASWEVASVIVSLFGAMLGLLWIRHYLFRSIEDSTKDE